MLCSSFLSGTLTVNSNHLDLIKLWSLPPKLNKISRCCKLKVTSNRKQELRIHLPHLFPFSQGSKLCMIWGLPVVWKPLFHIVSPGFQFFFFFFFAVMGPPTQSLWDFRFLTKDQPWAPAVKGPTPNHWAAREISSVFQLWKDGGAIYSLSLHYGSGWKSTFSFLIFHNIIFKLIFAK